MCHIIYKENICPYCGNFYGGKTNEAKCFKKVPFKKCTYAEVSVDIEVINCNSCDKKMINLKLNEVNIKLAGNMTGGEIGGGFKKEQYQSHIKIIDRKKIASLIEGKTKNKHLELEYKYLNKDVFYNKD